MNQQLDAEIDLLSVAPSEADKLTVSLASYETFAKLGVDRPAILMLLNFEVHKRSNGTPYITVRSKELINEPFLDFLVEVTWPSGKVLREYTLLLDPPSMSAQQEPVFVETPQAATAPAELPVQEPVVSPPVDMASVPGGEEPQPAQTPLEQEGGPAEQEGVPEQTVAGVEAQADQQQPDEDATTPATGAAEPPPEQVTARAPKEKAPVEPASVSSDALVYGPVKRNEYLYQIANRMRPDESITAEQMMIALYNSNREAFIHNNINLLRKGAVLRIDDPATLRALSQAEARRQVARHGRAWEEYRSKIAASTPKSVPAESAAETAKAGSTVAPTTEESKLTLVAPSKPGEGKQGKVGGTADKGGEVEFLRKELLAANETAVVLRKENEELNKRRQELEGQLQDAQKIISAKSDTLAALQLQQKLDEQQKAAAGTAAATAKPAQPAQPALVEPAAPEAAKVEPAPEEVKVEPSSAVTPPEGAAPISPAAGEEAKPMVSAEGTAPAAGAATEKAAAEAAKPRTVPKKPRPAVPTTPPPQPSIVDQLLENPMYQGGAVGVLLLVLGVVWLMRKRRQGRGFQESILTVGATSSMMKGKGENPASETSFLSDLAISGMGGRVHQEESDVDPLTEADVYMAYNRFPQAEELLKEGLKHNPEREELHAKLLEVYYKSRNRQAFEQIAESRVATMQRNKSMWDKVVAMGHELAPDNPLFKGAATAGGAALFASAASAEPAAASEVFDIGLDLDALSSEMEAAGAPGSDVVDLGLDFSDFGMEDSAKKKPEEPEPELVAATSDLDFNFDLGGSETSAEPAESPSLDFDFSAFGSEAEPSVQETSEPLQVEESSLGSLDFDLSSMAEETPAEEQTETSLDFGDFDLSSVAAEASEAGQESSFDLGSLDFGSGGDELAADSGSETIDFGNLDLGSGAEEPAMDLADLGDFSDFSDLGADSSFGSMDEVGTKLDLAKAYVDMGDSDAARGMLEEVMQEGSDDQKQQAKELLSQLA